MDPSKVCKVCKVSLLHILSQLRYLSASGGREIQWGRPQLEMTLWGRGTLEALEKAIQRVDELWYNYSPIERSWSVTVNHSFKLEATTTNPIIEKDASSSSVCV